MRQSNMNYSMISNYKNSNIKPNEPFNSKNYITANCRERDVEIYKEVFDMFDAGKKGFLNPSDLKTSLQMFGFYPKKALIYQMIADIDNEESGIITFQSFVKIMNDSLRPCDIDTEEDYERVFNYFDQDNNEYITREEIMRVAVECGEKLSENELDLIMEKLDPENTGKVNFKVFHKSLKDACMIKRLNK